MWTQGDIIKIIMGDTDKTKILKLRISPAWKERYFALAEKEGKTISEVIRDLLASWYDRKTD